MKQDTWEERFDKEFEYSELDFKYQEAKNVIKEYIKQEKNNTIKDLLQKVRDMKVEVYRNATNPRDAEIFNRSYGFNLGISEVETLLKDSIEE